MKFTTFADTINTQFLKMAKQDLYEITLEKNELWDLYLASFPEGTNPLYKERTEHDCQCCKHFIRDVGGVVNIVDNKLVTLWDVKVGGFYQIVIDALAAYVRKKAISNVLSCETSGVGSEVTHQQLEDGQIKVWSHFYCSVPKNAVRISPEVLSNNRAAKQVFKRGLDEITTEAIDIVLELIDQNSLYRGDEFKNSIKEFSALKKQYGKITDAAESDNYCWANSKKSSARLRNTVMGTLLQDISDGSELDVAVRAYESKVAPANYKRPTALITKGMVEKAMKTIKELDIEKSLYRRFAIAEDLSINNVLFADRATAAVMKDELLDSLMKEVKTEAKNYSKVEDISIEKFVQLIPSITQMEVLFENRHTKNLMSLIAPKHEDSPNILKWNNNFSWSYNGDMTDSIKERVKKAGGNVEGFLRISLSWFNYDDLDIHVKEPEGFEIYYGNKKNARTTGHLDVDMNAGTTRTKKPVENIVWTIPSRMETGQYKVFVQNYCKRETTDVGFVVEMEINGEIRQYHYIKAISNQVYLDVFTFKFDGEKITDIIVGKEIQDEAKSQQVWDCATEQFQKVSLMTVSPNHWDENKVGNKHYFFILDGCKNPDKTRGFYNEFLTPNLEKHRKVFEVLGNKTKCEESNNQLSGLGFSSTKKDNIICKVSGNFNRILRVTF